MAVKKKPTTPIAPPVPPPTGGVRPLLGRLTSGFPFAVRGARPAPPPPAAAVAPVAPKRLPQTPVQLRGRGTLPPPAPPPQVAQGRGTVPTPEVTAPTPMAAIPAPRPTLPPHMQGRFPNVIDADIAAQRFAARHPATPDTTQGDLLAEQRQFRENLANLQRDNKYNPGVTFVPGSGKGMSTGARQAGAATSQSFYSQESGEERTSAGGRSGASGEGQVAPGTTPQPGQGVPSLGNLPTNSESVAAMLEQLGKTRQGHIFEVNPLLQRILNRRGISEDLSMTMNMLGFQGIGDIGLYGFNTDYVVPQQFQWNQQVTEYLDAMPEGRSIVLELILATALGMEAPDPFQRPLWPEASLATPATTGQ